MTARVLIASTTDWPASARLAGAFAQSGCAVQALAPARAPVRESRHVERHHPYRPAAPLASLAAALAEAEPDLIVPCDDRMVRHLLKFGGDVAARSLGELAQYETLLSRVGQIAVAREQGIVAPKTVAVTSEAVLDYALGHVGLPAVLKTDGSWGGEGVAFAATRGEAFEAYRRLKTPVSWPRGLARAWRRRDLHHAVDALAPPPPAISLQAFVAGTPANTAFACWQGAVLAMVHVEVLMESKPGGPASVVRRVASPEMDAAARTLAARFGLSGLHGLDFMRDGEGALHFIELNPRATQIAAMAWGPGLDCPAALARMARQATDRPAATELAVVALFPQEWSRDPASAYLATAHHDVPWDDPGVVRVCLEKGGGRMPLPDAAPLPGLELPGEPAAPGLCARTAQSSVNVS